MAVAVAVIVLLASFWYLGRVFQWGPALDRLANMDRMVFFGGGVSSIVAYILFRTVRWQRLLGTSAAGASFPQLYVANAVAIAAANFTPAQSGELLKVVLVTRLAKLPRWDGVTKLVVERVADLTIVLAFAAIGLVTHPGPLSMSGTARQYLAPLLLVAVAAAFVIMLRLATRRITSLAELDGRTLAETSMLTVAAWAFVATGWWSAAASVGVWLSLFDTVGLIGIVSLGAVLSLLPGAVGVADALTSTVLQRWGHSAADAQAAALAIRAFGLMWIPIGLAHLGVGVTMAIYRRSAVSPATGE